MTGGILQTGLRQEQLPRTFLGCDSSPPPRYCSCLITQQKRQYPSLLFSSFSTQFVCSCTKEQNWLWMVFPSLCESHHTEGQTGLFEDLNYFIYFNSPFLAMSSTCWVRLPKKPVSFTHSCSCNYITNRNCTSHLNRSYSWLGGGWRGNHTKVNHSVISLMRKRVALTEW